MPDFVSAEIKARRVLAAFLEPDQLEDFRRYNRFVSVGQTTGHRYMITSRHANDELTLRHTVLFDVDDNHSVCVHDWDIPTAEEMLALHIYLQIPDGERFLRSFPGDLLFGGGVYDQDGLEVYNDEEAVVIEDGESEILRTSVRQAVNQILIQSEK